MNQSADRISDTEDRIAFRDYKKKDFLNIASDHEKSVQ